MKQYLVEITFLLYGLYLLNEAQYLSFLILLVLSLILVIKGVKHKESLVITMVILLFITQYHRYFPAREPSNPKSKDINIQENFKSKLNPNDKKMIIEKAERKKKRNERKKIKQQLEKEIRKSNSDLPIKYLKNKKKIDEKTNSWGDSLSKWYLFKQNFFILLNNDD